MKRMKRIWHEYFWDGYMSSFWIVVIIGLAGGIPLGIYAGELQAQQWKWEQAQAQTTTCTCTCVCGSAQK